MVTASKKPKAAPKAKAASKPKVAVKAAPKAAPKAKAASKPKVAVKAKAVPKPKVAIKAKAAASKPKTTAKAQSSKASVKTAKKTTAATKAAEVRKVGEMVYNDELFEALSEAVLLGEAGATALLPEIKKRMYDFDIYMVSFLTNEDINGIAKDLSRVSGGKPTENALKPRLLAVRDNARFFVDIATRHNSVRAFIDRIIRAEGRDKLKVSFTKSLKEVGPETCESFLLLF